MYYVSYITEYPIYEPAEGGYYYAGTTVENCRVFSSWRKANKYYQLLRKWFLEEYGYCEEERKRIDERICSGVDRYGDGSCIYYRSKYVGEGARVDLRNRQPVERGWEPYC